MTNVVGVRFRQAGKIYYFDPKDFSLERGMHVVVETARGVEYGTVILPPKTVPDEEVVLPLKEVLRIATEQDEETESNNRFREREAYLVCQKKIQEHGLEMKLVQAEYTFDNNKLLFYFTAEGRIDFRDLVKDLAGEFRTRIELRQIGVRDETKILGGIGICGRPLCCHTYLADFAPVSIKMAKEQNLSLNPTKISGTCGRLMCCLKNEQDTYEYLNSTMPRVGEWVSTSDGFRGEVAGINVLRQTARVLVDTGDAKEIREYSVDDLAFRGKQWKEKEAKKPAKEADKFAKEAGKSERESGKSAKESGKSEKESGKSERESGKAAKEAGKSAKEKKSQRDHKKDGRIKAEANKEESFENTENKNEKDNRTESEGGEKKNRNRHRNHRHRNRNHNHRKKKEGTTPANE